MHVNARKNSRLKKSEQNWNAWLQVYEKKEARKELDKTDNNPQGVRASGKTSQSTFIGFSEKINSLDIMSP